MPYESDRHENSERYERHDLNDDFPVLYFAVLKDENADEKSSQGAECVADIARV